MFLRETATGEGEKRTALEQRSGGSARGESLTTIRDDEAIVCSVPSAQVRRSLIRSNARGFLLSWIRVGIGPGPVHSAKPKPDNGIRWAGSNGAFED